MKYFLLPKLPVFYQTALALDIVSSETHDPGKNIIISHSLCNYLHNIKNEIDDYKPEWEVYKIYTNPYEFVHAPSSSSSSSSSMKDPRSIITDSSSVGKFRPLSRSFYKMVELLSFFRCGGIFRKDPVRTFHLAEGPGGFIEAVTYFRGNQCDGDEYIGMTLVVVGGGGGGGGDPSHNNTNHHHHIPSWKKSKHFLKANPMVNLEYGSDQTGNILSLANFELCYQKYQSSMDFVTGDGGFDFSGNYNEQELAISSLLFGQIAYAVATQKRGGAFILKVFDIFHQSTVDLVAFLSSLYENVYVTKPNISRYVNSEKYLVCINFIPSAREVRESIYPLLHASLKSLLEQNVHRPSSSSSSSSPMLYVKRYLDHRKVDIPLFYLTKLKEINSIIGQQQIEKIYFTLVLIKTKHKNEDKIKSLIAKNKDKCVQWCKFHQIPINSWAFLH